jgi:hypothetical protein
MKIIYAVLGIVCFVGGIVNIRSDPQVATINFLCSALMLHITGEK